MHSHCASSAFRVAPETPSSWYKASIFLPPGVSAASLRSSAAASLGLSPHQQSLALWPYFPQTEQLPSNFAACFDLPLSPLVLPFGPFLPVLAPFPLLLAPPRQSLALWPYLPQLDQLPSNFLSFLPLLPLPPLPPFHSSAETSIGVGKSPRSPAAST